MDPVITYILYGVFYILGAAGYLLAAIIFGEVLNQGAMNADNYPVKVIGNRVRMLYAFAAVAVMVAMCSSMFGAPWVFFIGFCFSMFVLVGRALND